MVSECLPVPIDNGQISLSDLDAALDAVLSLAPTDPQICVTERGMQLLCDALVRAGWRAYPSVEPEQEGPPVDPAAAARPVRISLYEGVWVVLLPAQAVDIFVMGWKPSL